MVLGLSLGLLGLLGLSFGVAKLSDDLGVIGGASSSLSTTDGGAIGSDRIAENTREFTEKYLSDSVLDSSTSPQPYISSPEVTRPQGSSNGSGNDDKGKKDNANSNRGIFTALGLSAGVGGVAGWALGSDVEDAIENSGFWYGAVLGVVGVVILKKVFD